MHHSTTHATKVAPVELQFRVCTRVRGLTCGKQMSLLCAMSSRSHVRTLGGALCTHASFFHVYSCSLKRLGHIVNFSPCTRIHALRAVGCRHVRSRGGWTGILYMRQPAPLALHSSFVAYALAGRLLFLSTLRQPSIHLQVTRVHRRHHCTCTARA